MTARATNKSPAAFARADLCAVAAAMALLALLLFTAAASTRSANRATVCLANLRRLSTAATLYAQASNDYLPHPGWGSPPDTTDGWAYAARNNGRLVGVAGQVPSADGKADDSPEARDQLAYLRLGQIWPMMRDEKAYKCPSDQPVTASERAAYLARNIKSTSYTMNACVSGLANQLTPSGKTYRIFQFKADDMLFFEPDERQPFWFNDTGNQPTEGLTHRHFNGGHIGRIDGGAEFMSRTNYYRIANPAVPSRFYCGPQYFPTPP